MPVDIPAFAYAASVVAGGIIGYVKSNSVPSLTAGLLFGSMLGYGAYQTSQDPSNVAVLLSGSSLLGCMMGYRYYSTGKIMPAGMITLLSAAIVLRTVVRYFTAEPVKVQ